MSEQGGEGSAVAASVFILPQSGCCTYRMPCEGTTTTMVLPAASGRHATSHAYLGRARAGVRLRARVRVRVRLRLRLRVRARVRVRVRVGVRVRVRIRVRLWLGVRWRRSRRGR